MISSNLTNIDTTDAIADVFSFATSPASAYGTSPGSSNSTVAYAYVGGFNSYYQLTGTGFASDANGFLTGGTTVPDDDLS